MGAQYSKFCNKTMKNVLRKGKMVFNFERKKKKLEETKIKDQVVEELSFLKHLPNKHGIQIPSNLVLAYLLSLVNQSLLPLFFFFLLTRHIYSIFEKIKFLLY